MLFRSRGILTPSGRDLLTKLKPPGLSARQPSSEEAEAMIQESVLQPAAKAPAAPVEAPKPAAIEIVDRFPMGENTEYRVVKTQVGYAANLYDADAGKYVPGSARIFPTKTFGDQAQAKATEFARGEFEKTQPKPAAPKAVEPEAKPTEADEKAKAKQDLEDALGDLSIDRKSTRLNSSH